MVAGNRIFFALVGLAISFSAGAIVGGAFSSPKQPAGLNAAEYNQLKISHQQLGLENNELKNQLRAIKYSSAITPSSSPKSPDTTITLELSSNANIDTQIKAELSVAVISGVPVTSISEKIQQNPQFDLTTELADRFANEELDIVWASQQENIVRDLFLDNEALATVLPDSILCKSLRCQIRIPLVDLEDGNRASIALATAIAATPALSHLGIVSGFDYEHAALEIYLPRNPDVDLLQ